MPIANLSSFPQAPSLSDPANFQDEAAAWVAFMSTFTSQMNSTIAEINQAVISGGGSAPIPSEEGDFDALVSGGFWSISNNWENGPSGASASPYTGTCLVIERAFAAGAAITQFLFTYSVSTGLKADVRVGSGDPLSFSDWEKLYHGGNAPLREHDVTIADDAAAILTPPRNAGVMIVLYNPTSGFPGLVRSGALFFDCGDSPDIMSIVSGASFVSSSSLDLTGTGGADGNITVSTQPANGTIQLENRSGNSSPFRVLFM